MYPYFAGNWVKYDSQKLEQGQLYYTAKNATDLLQVVNFTGLSISSRCNKSVNKSRKSFVGKIWEAESAVSEYEGPQKSWGNKTRVRVRALTVMDLESHVLTGLSTHEATKRCEDQDGSKGPRRYGPCSPSLVCALPWGSVAVWTPLSAPLTLFNNCLHVECIYSYNYNCIYSLIS